MNYWAYQYSTTSNLSFYKLLSIFFLFGYLANATSLIGQIPTLINESPPCGFEQIYENVEFPTSNSTATETNLGLSIAYSFNGRANNIIEKEFIIDENGNLLDSVIIETPVDTIIQGAIIDDNAFIAAQGITEDTTIRLFKTDFQGQELWEQRFLFNPINQIFSLSPTEVFATEDAYYILGNYVDADTSSNRVTYFFFAIKTDKTGKLLLQNSYPARDFIQPRIAAIDGNDNVYISYQTSSRIAYIAKLGVDSTLLWDSRIIGDLVSNRVRTIELSNDGQAIIVAGYSDPKAFVRKYDIETGELLWDVRPGELFSTDGDFTVQERLVGIIQTADDGIIVSYPYQSTNNFSDAGKGEEYGKLDTDGTPIWWQRLSDHSFGGSRPVLETAKGEILFLARSDKGQLVAFKTTETGSLLPNCDPLPTTCDLLNSIDLDPCDPLVREVAVYAYQGNNFLVTVPDMSMIADLPTVVRSCETGEQFCVFGFVVDPEPCRIFFEEATKIQTVLTKAIDCTKCICPEIEELVCGEDGQVYNNPCEADCAGVAWVAGSCPDETPFIDLELAINTPNPNPVIYTRLPLTITINNKGNIAAENVVVRLTMCGDQSSGFQQSSGLVYSSTNYTATQGAYNYSEQRWDLSELEAGGSAVLTIHLFNLTTDQLNIATYISDASPEDIDSTPGFIKNVGSCVTDEDDEVQLGLNAIRICDCSTDELNPVCGSDGYTYDNPCEATCVGVSYEAGACATASGMVTCKEITVSYEKGKIDIIGQQEQDYFFKVHRRLPIWEYVFQCNSKCGFGQTIENLAGGTYYIDVYDKSWHLICDDIEVPLGKDAFQSTINEQRSRISELPANSTLEQSSFESLTIYPNPARDRLTIDLNHKAYQNGQLYFSDAFGRLVKEISLQQLETSIPITDLKNGVYQLHLVVNGRIITTDKLVILR